MFIPKTQPKLDKRKKLRMNKAAMTLRKKKYESWKRYTETRDYLDYVGASRDRDKLTCMSRKLRRDFEHNLARNIKANPKAFWRYSNSKLKNKTQIRLSQTRGQLTHSG